MLRSVRTIGFVGLMLATVGCQRHLPVVDDELSGQRKSSGAGTSGARFEDAGKGASTGSTGMGVNTGMSMSVAGSGMRKKDAAGSGADVGNGGDPGSNAAAGSGSKTNGQSMAAGSGNMGSAVRAGSGSSNPANSGAAASSGNNNNGPNGNGSVAGAGGSGTWVAGNQGQGGGTSLVNQKASAMVTGFMGSPVNGTIKFDVFEENLTIDFRLRNCKVDAWYEVTVGTGTSCADESSIGGEFGEAFARTLCGETGALGSSLNAAKLTENSIGGDPATNVVGHVAVVREQSPNAMAMVPTACGIIMMQPQN